MAQYLDREAVEKVGGEMSDGSASSEVQESEGELSEEIPLSTTSIRSRKRFSFLDDDVAANKRRKSSSCGSKTPTNSSRAANTPTSSSARTPSSSKSSTTPSRQISKSSGKHQYEDLLKEMKHSNKLLSTLVSRADSTEERLKLVEEKLDEVSEMNTTPKSKQARRRSVPDEVRVSGYL